MILILDTCYSYNIKDIFILLLAELKLIFFHSMHSEYWHCFLLYIMSH